MPSLNNGTARPHWRSLAEVSLTPQSRDLLRAEFRAPVDEESEGINRRGFLRLMGASAALAGLVGCTRQPIEPIVPYVHQPEDLVPGKPLFFATAREHDGFATGLLVESHEGHPTKIEGNPDHPGNRGTTSIFDQASILDLYDPDRAQAIRAAGEISTWGAFLSVVNAASQSFQADQGAGLRLLTETVTSPALAAQLQALLKKFPKARWHQFQPICRDNVKEGARLAFGEFVESHWRFDKARVVLALDSDFLFAHPAHLRHAREFTALRRLSDGAKDMNRLYALESTPSITGSMADHRLPLESGQIGVVALAIARRIGVAGVSVGAELPAGAAKDWVDAVARDLQRNAGASLVVVGERQPPAVHELAHRMNEALGNAGKTITYSASAEAEPILQLDSLRDLVADMRGGLVDMLFVLGGNPVFTAPADIAFAEELHRVKTIVHLGAAHNETSAYAHWHIPQSHYLESWSDTRAFDGTVSIVQPLIQPLYESRSAHEIMAAMIQQPAPGNYEIVRDSWRQRITGADFESAWRKAVHDGLMPDTQSPVKTVHLTAPQSDRMEKILEQKPVQPTDSELTFHPDPAVWDGSFANNSWLQELARPVSKLTWDNAALISPQLARSRQLDNGDVVQLRFRGRALRVPVWITAGQAENSVALHLGQGRARVGRVGAGAGFNAYSLRASDAMWFGTGLEIVKTSEKYPLASTQLEHVVEGYDVLFGGVLKQFQANPNFVQSLAEQEGASEPPKSDTLYNPSPTVRDGYQWGMAIDMNACIGCNACMMACQSENNIPVVGKDQVARGRDMAWIRIDTYFTGGTENPELTHMPVPCMHCENAPCELVCPVGATVHDHEGLNVQVYNRCVGTRYCSNNCPYKVRRFNFYQYADYRTPSLKPMRNPDVTVRWRGVMEKCTYCVQRISVARINAEEQDRTLRDGEVVTACQQACPTQAIVFGNIADPDSRVSKMKKSPLNYSMLGSLNARPRTTYLARVRNPNPELETTPHA